MTAQHSQLEEAKNAMQAYALTVIDINPIDSGLLNQTFELTTDDSDKFVLQAVNPMFSPETILDIHHITEYLHHIGMPVPRLISSNNQQPYTVYKGQMWRVYTHIDGETKQHINSAEAAQSAGAALADMHHALTGLNYDLKFSRPGVHDTARHIQHLHNSLQKYSQHPDYADIQPVAKRIITTYEQLPGLSARASRLVHGDPKISNFIYEKDTDTVRCMVDFDTFSYMPLCVELGDALRSWCNPNGEDTTAGTFVAATAIAALTGYAAHSREFIVEKEWRDIMNATLTMYIELAARFCADALSEDYFAWDSTRFQSHAEHSLVRAQGQLNAAYALQTQLPQLQTQVIKLFSE